MTTEFLGYHCSYDMKDLTTFIAEAEMRYDSLEQAIMPVDTDIADLKKNWALRPPQFWARILRDYLPSIRSAAARCLDLFDPKQRVMPICVLATRLSYIGDLSSIDVPMEEAGILLSAYVATHLRVPGRKRSVKQSIEQSIRERQRMMRALQKLSEAVHLAIDNGRAELMCVPARQLAILAPLEKREALPFQVVKDQP